jgi:hypothetical protein
MIIALDRCMKPRLRCQQRVVHFQKNVVDYYLPKSPVIRPAHLIPSPETTIWHQIAALPFDHCVGQYLSVLCGKIQ